MNRLRNRPEERATIPGLRVVTETHFETDFPAMRERSSVDTMRAFYAGDRYRTDSGEGPETGCRIERRDLRQIIEVLGKQHRYRLLPLFEVATEEEKEQFARSGRAWQTRHATDTKHPRLEYPVDITYERTEEQKTFFDMTATRWTICRTEEFRDTSAQPMRPDRESKETTDAWYLDAATVVARFPLYARKLLYQPRAMVVMNNQHPVVEHHGERPHGLCMLSESKAHGVVHLRGGETRESTHSRSTRIVELSEEELPLTLFEPPSGFREIPVYPSRWAMWRSDLRRFLQRRGFAPRAAHR